MANHRPYRSITYHSITYHSITYHSIADRRHLSLNHRSLNRRSYFLVRTGYAEHTPAAGHETAEGAAPRLQAEAAVGMDFEKGAIGKLI